MNFYYLFNKVLVHFYLSYFHAFYFANTLGYIFCIICYLGALRISQKIQVTCSLQKDDLFTTGYRSRKHIRGCSTLPPNWKMAGLGYWDEFPMVRALVFMITLQTLQCST